MASNDKHARIYWSRRWVGPLLENLFHPHMLVVKPTKIGLGPPPPSSIRQTKISPEPTKVKKKTSSTAPDNWTKKHISTSKDYLKAFKHSTCLFKWNVRLWINTRILYRRLSLKKINKYWFELLIDKKQHPLPPNTIPSSKSVNVVTLAIYMQNFWI